MPYVETSITVRSNPGEAYEIAKDMESYPKFMPNAKSIKVIERGENYTITAWDTLVDNRLFKWQERDDFDEVNSHISYRQISGDLKKFEGEWMFEAVPEGTKITLTVDFELGIPMLATLLNPYLKKVVRSNAESMLNAIKEQLEK